MGPTWGPPGSCRPRVGPTLASWTLLSGVVAWQRGVPCLGDTSSNDRQVVYAILGLTDQGSRGDLAKGSKCLCDSPSNPINDRLVVYAIPHKIIIGLASICCRGISNEWLVLGGNMPHASTWNNIHIYVHRCMLIVSVFQMHRVSHQWWIVSNTKRKFWYPSVCHMWPLLLTWFNFNGMDK